jgi:hypothetical protein
MKPKIATFLIGCIGTRLAITLLAKWIPLEYLPLMGIPALAIAIGFTLIYVNGWRKTGIEVGGGQIWWNALRPVHAFLWGLFGILALLKQPFAWIVLLVDTLIGLSAFIIKHKLLF